VNGGPGQQVSCISTILRGKYVRSNGRPASIRGRAAPRETQLVAFAISKQRVSDIDATNTPRISALMRAGNTYLSLADAISIAIENNLDVQAARYQFETARTDVTRSKGGGTLRGVGVEAFEVASGVRGPASPLITNTATGAPPATSVPTNIFDLGYLQGTAVNHSLDPGLYSSPLPSAAGPPIPQHVRPSQEACCGPSKILRKIVSRAPAPTS
jgi:hypothetical protein